MSYKAGEHSKAIAYYDEATKLATEKMDKADYQYKIAQIYYTEMNNYPRSREYARNSLEFNPNNGSAYLLIGIMYAKSRSIYDDPVLSKTVYWVAVDKFVRAKQVDPSIADEANKLINTYSGHFPTKDDMFFQPQKPTLQMKGNGKVIDEATARKYLNAYGGDKNKAREAAKKDGWKVQ